MIFCRQGKRAVSLLSKNAGASLLELMLVASISMSLLYAMGEITVGQGKEVRTLYQKTELIEFKNALDNAVRSEQGCYLKKLVDPSTALSLVIDTTGITTTDFGTNPPAFALKVLPGAGSSPDLGWLDSLIPGSGNIVISKILFDRVLATGIPNEYRGTLKIEFDPNRMQKTYGLTGLIAPGIKPIEIDLKFKTTAADPVNAKTILSCQSGLCPVGTVATDFSCVDKALVQFTVPGGPPYGDVDKWQQAAAAACQALGRQVADINDVVIYCDMKGPPLVGGSPVNYYLENGKSSANGCNITINTPANAHYTYVMCSFPKKTHSC